MPYRVTLTVTAQSIKIDENGDFIRSPSGREKLDLMGLPETPPVLAGRNPDGTYNTTRDFDTEDQANEWLDYYKERPAYIDGNVSQVDEKIITVHSSKYFEKIENGAIEQTWLEHPGAD
jgi:hypothetical protein